MLEAAVITVVSMFLIFNTVMPILLKEEASSKAQPETKFTYETFDERVAREHKEYLSRIKAYQSTVNTRQSTVKNTVNTRKPFKKSKTSAHYLYLIQTGEDTVKIGIASNPKRRLRELQTGNPYSLKLLDTVKFKSKVESYSSEQKLHTQFKHYRVKGEHFNHKAKIIVAFKKFKSQQV